MGLVLYPVEAAWKPKLALANILPILLQSPKTDFHRDKLLWPRHRMLLSFDQALHNS